MASAKWIVTNRLTGEQYAVDADSADSALAAYKAENFTPDVAAMVGDDDLSAERTG